MATAGCHAFTAELRGVAWPGKFKPNLPPGSISSWDEMRTRFIANFQGTRDRLPAMGDLRRIKQQPGETLQKYIQHFNNARLKIPR